jgi:NADPH:quinone reductase-like Zn-dependent oxidoreductase
MIESGAIVLPTPTTFPFTEAAAAHARLESGDHLGKIILTA